MNTRNQARNRRTALWMFPIALFSLLSSLTALHAQVFEWARMGGGYGWKHGNGIAVDSADNSIIVGEFSGVSNTAKDPSIYAIAFGDHRLNARGYVDGFVVMYDSTGREKWVLQLGGLRGAVTAKAIAMYRNRTFFITGQLSDTVLFNDDTVTGRPGSSFVAKLGH